MRRLLSIAALSGVLGWALFAGSPALVDAHETRALADGRYQIVVGFQNEPVFAGDKSGLEFTITDVSQATPGAGEDAEGAPVEGLAESLTAEVIFEDQTMELPLEEAWNEPGSYGSVFFPMEPGTYTFRIYGTIGDVEIDETFTSGPETFGDVADPAPLQFPKS